MPDRPSSDTEAPTRSARPAMAREVQESSLPGLAFRGIERVLLAIIALMTIIAAGLELWSAYEARDIDLADILLMFLYTEVIGMIAVFYTGRGSPFVYPIFIAMTALARLIVLQGKDMAPENILYEAAAILLLAIAAVIILKSRISPKAFASDER